METLHHQVDSEGIQKEQSPNERYRELLAVGFVGFLMLSSVWSGGGGALQEYGFASIEDAVLPPNGVELPVAWGDIGAQLVASGVIDAEQFESLYDERGGLTIEEKKLLYGNDNGAITINKQNAGFLLNVLWALGLGNKNPVLDEGPMQDPRYGYVGDFASTGGWTIAKGGVVHHYSAHQFITLTPEQQNMVERVAQNIYRPCCGNSTYFPDCNHGMAMLGLLELMASQGVSEEEMYAVALQVNSYWFPDTYITIAEYMALRNVAWNDIDPKTVLGSAYSSAQGFGRILKEVEQSQPRGEGSCGV